MIKLIFLSSVFFLSCSQQAPEKANYISQENPPEKVKVNEVDSTDFLKFIDLLPTETLVDVEVFNPFIQAQDLKQYLLEKSSTSITSIFHVDDKVLIGITNRAEKSGQQILFSFTTEGTLIDVKKVQIYNSRGDNIVQTVQFLPKNNSIFFDILTMVHDSDSKPIFREKDVERISYFINQNGHFQKVD